MSHRGWGLSSPASPDTASAYSITALASDVVTLLPQFVDQGLVSPSGFILCGHSMGAKVAMAVGGLLNTSQSQNFPPLRGMLLLAPAPPSPLILPDDMREQQIHAYESQEAVEWTVREVLTGAHGTRLYGGKRDFEMIVRDSLAGCEGAKKAWPEVGMADNVTFGARLEEPRGGILGADENQRKMKLTVLVSRGDKVETVDRVKQETVQPLRANGFNVRLRILEPEDCDAGETAICGHILPLEAPGVVVEELAGLLKHIDESGS